MHTVFIKHIIYDWHMGQIHALREHRRVGLLRKNEVLLALNHKRTIARFIDNEEGVHTYYAPEKVRFNLDKLNLIATQGLGITLQASVVKQTKLKRVA